MVSMQTLPLSRVKAAFTAAKIVRDFETAIHLVESETEARIYVIPNGPFNIEQRTSKWIFANHDEFANF